MLIKKSRDDVWYSKSSFEQIELIFVMVIVGILAVAAIPRVVAKREEAHAAKCTQEAQQPISEISYSYTFYGYHPFSLLPIETITNLPVGVDEEDGIASPQGSLILDGIISRCDGEDTLEAKGALTGTEYHLILRDLSPNTPASHTASKWIRQLNGMAEVGGEKAYKLQ